MAPWPPTSRLASSTTSWRMSAGSRRAVIRAAISRSACSASARRASRERERSSSSMSRARVMAMAAWAAIEPSRSACGWSQASGPRW